jgi:hypothetical protein
MDKLFEQAFDDELGGLVYLIVLIEVEIDYALFWCFEGAGKIIDDMRSVHQ